MGNAFSSNGEPLAVGAVAKSTSLTKGQILAIRDSCEDFSKKGMVQRKMFHVALANCHVATHPDMRILDLLFTIHDVRGKDRVPFLDFCVSIAPLACRFHSLSSALSFAMKVQDIEETGMIDAGTFINIVRCINSTAAYFGDRVLTDRQIYKLADNIFDTLTLISSQDPSEEMTHRECMNKLKEEPLVKQLESKRKSSSVVTFADVLDSSGRQDDASTSTDMSSVLLTPIARLHVDSPSQVHKKTLRPPALMYRKRKKQRPDVNCLRAAQQESDDDDESSYLSDMSSVFLSPLGKQFFPSRTETKERY